MEKFWLDTLHAVLENPQLGMGWVLAIYLLWRLHQVTDRQHDAIVETTKVLAAIKTFLTTKFGGGME